MFPVWLASCVNGVLTMASGVYWLGHQARQRGYQLGLLRSHRFEGVKVISVGNLTWGGTGKTPLVIWLAQALQAKGRKVAVLMRGYGGDEPLVIKAHVNGVPVFAGPDRVKNARAGLKLVPIDVFILDDGFQHYQIARDLEIVTVDTTKPLGTGHLIPRGTLRESPAALKRADLAVLTKTDLVNAVQLSFVESLLRTFHNTLPIVHTVHEPVALWEPASQRDLGLEALRGKRVAAVSAIGDPEGFERTVQRLGATVVKTMRYRDHYWYRASDVREIVRQAEAVQAEWVVTTEKDWVRLEKGPGPFSASASKKGLALIVKMRLKVTQGEEWLEAKLSSLAPLAR